MDSLEEKQKNFVKQFHNLAGEVVDAVDEFENTGNREKFKILKGKINEFEITCIQCGESRPLYQHLCRCGSIYKFGTNLEDNNESL